MPLSVSLGFPGEVLLTVPYPRGRYRRGSFVVLTLAFRDAGIAA